MNHLSINPPDNRQKLNPLDFPLLGTRLIEASAGTGKTWIIAALYIRLVLGHGSENARFDRALLPPDILVVTFTEAATRELRDRIRARLTQAAACFRGREEGDEFLRGVKSSYAETQWPGCARLLEISALWMDEAAVYTIHGWCNRMLQQHAFDSGSLFKQEVNTSDLELLNEVVRDYWRTFFYTLSEAEARAVVKIAASPQALSATVKPLLELTEVKGLETAATDPRELFAAWAAWDDARNALERQAQQTWRNAQAEIEALLRAASEQGWLHGNSYRKNTFEQRLNDFAGWAGGGARPKAEWFGRFAQTRFGMNARHKDKLPQHAAFVAVDTLLQCESEEPDFTREVIVHAALWVRERYSREKQRRARMDFNDMLTRLDRTLQSDSGEQLAAVIRKQYPVALIDEFQDTDPLQYRIFKRIYQPDSCCQGLGCLLIGDPKQAIYSFRGADIHTYLQAHADTAGRHYTLDTNFRSTAGLVAAVNRIFQHAEHRDKGAFLFKNAAANPVAFHPVAAQGVDQALIVNGKAVAPMTFLHWGADQEKPVSSTAYRQYMAQAAATDMVRLLNLSARGGAGFSGKTGIQPLKPSAIAILVRTRKEAKAMQAALAQRQLRSVYLSEGDSVFNSREALDLLFWLKAAAEPRDERKVRAALATATLDLSLPELEVLNCDESAWERQLERFRQYQLRWQKDGVLPMIRSLLSDYRVSSRLMNSSADSGGERSLTNLLHLAELLQKTAAHLDGEQALIRYLAEAMAAAQADGGLSSDEATIRLESDAELIKIITIHKSKGLEYPLVFLPFIASFREVTAQYSSYYRYHDDDDALRVDLSRDETARAKNDFERLQEDMRLLYVALTRAKHQCRLGVAPLKNMQNSALGYLLGWEKDAAPSNLPKQLGVLAGGSGVIAVDAAPEPDNTPYNASTCAVGAGAPAVRTATANIPDAWWIASYSALRLEAETDANERGVDAAETAHDDKWLDESASDTVENRSLDALTLARTGIHALPRGAEPGTAIHELMETSARQGFREPTGKELEKFCRGIGWESWTDILRKSLADWLHMPLLADAAISLSGLQRHAYQPELEFLLPVHGLDLRQLDALVTRHTFDGRARPRLQHTILKGMLKGYIDLVFEHDNRFYVVDYKFNALGDSDAAYNREELENVMLQKRYDLQYVIYLLALHRQLKARMGATYNYDTHIGGALYLFLRGSSGPRQGRVCDCPPKTLIEALDVMLTGRACPA
ncbi:exodeoxyribonuclease V subunit beta [Candidatus Methylospira mobilis]|uniref:RecBCD enzyme subunit RecB n=1 Tax=Candidatus Methylospira mobilis TaxID=1808979 RepID=A0A5Q0BLX0_9GAMM|nr:exodeoxyribonuclease V subunit beta [Candidatus Methylospira mobilis]QFY43214.1 exodeoxyribonuclease V subunit beta [Candidatus Methylospira mobilis]